MSALQKLAVAREVGTSRSAGTAPTSLNSKSTNRDPGCQEAQQISAELHPLLKSLNFPGSGKAANTATQASNRDRSISGAKNRTAGSNVAAPAFAKALKQNHGMLQGSSSAHQLLQSLATKQLEQQIKQLATHAKDNAAAAQARAGETAIISITTPDGPAQASLSKQTTASCSGNGCTSLHHALVVAAAAAASVALAVPAEIAKRPVTPLITKPHKPGSIWIQPTCSAKHGCSSAAAAHGKLPHACSSSHSPGTAGSIRHAPAALRAVASSKGGVQTSQSATICPIVRPGTAAAFKILHSLNHQSSGAASRPHTARDWGSSSRAAQSARTAPGQQLLQFHDELPPYQQNEGCHLQNNMSQPDSQPRQHQQQRQDYSSSELDSLSNPEADKQSRAQQQQPEKDARYTSRPSTAALRALLASSHSKDGIAERLEHYRKLNSVNDDSEGLDILHEDEEKDEQLADNVPGWLKITSPKTSTCQSAPMVLNLEDLVQSTPEVLEAEIEQQLQELDLI